MHKVPLVSCFLSQSHLNFGCRLRFVKSAVHVGVGKHQNWKYNKEAKAERYRTKYNEAEEHQVKQEYLASYAPCKFPALSQRFDDRARSTRAFIDNVITEELQSDKEIDARNDKKNSANTNNNAKQEFAD